RQSNVRHRGEGRSPPPVARRGRTERMATDATSELSAHRAPWRPNPVTIIGFVLVALVVAWLAVNLVKTPEDLVTNLIIGITNGAVYGLIAIGYSLVYGILELINFAHGDVFMLGGMLTATLVASLGLVSGDAWYTLLGGILLMLFAAM